MNSCYIYIYNLQVSRFELTKIVSKVVKSKSFKHSKTSSIGLFEEENCVVNVYDRAIFINTFGDDNLKIAHEIKDELIENLNARSICFSTGGCDEWIDLQNYKPKLINRIRYALIDLLKE